MNRPLPDFENPPVIEVALSVNFKPLRAMTSAHAGLYWSIVRTKYPRTDDQPPLAASPEQEGTDFLAKTPQLEVLDKPPLPRVWFLNDRGNQLVQLQHDRFTHNWRKIQDGDVYPRYEQIRSTFESEFGEFREFVSAEELGAIESTQCEVTYVNHIQDQDVARVMAVWGKATGEFLPEPEDVRFASRYQIRDGNREFRGRLTANVQPARLVRDNSKIMVLTLTARGPAQSSDDVGIMRFMDMGREWIVRGFADLTTKEMHKAWGRKDK